jgi:hypothetical protein
MTPLTACWACGRSSKLEDDRLVFAEHFAGGDAEQQAITDLAGGAGNGNAHGGFGHVSLLFETAWLKLFVFAPGRF